MRRPATPITLPTAPLPAGAQRAIRRQTRMAGSALAAAVTAALLAAGAAGTAAAQSVERGRAVYQAHCAGCHSPDAHGDGPAHRGVVGRRAGALADFDYSPALRSSKILWTRATLKAWLTDPEALIPGQGMDYMLEDEREREDVVAYLASLKRATTAPARR